MRQFYNPKPNKSVIYAPLTSIKDSLAPFPCTRQSSSNKEASDLIPGLFEPGDDVIRFLLNYSKSLDITSASRTIIGEVCAFVKN